MSISQIILGVGNIGSEYEGTRHNIGFDVVDLLKKNAKKVTERKFKNSIVYEIQIGSTTVACLKPNTYVNLSGIAAEEALNYYELTVDDLLVVVDDFHIPLGSIRFRGKGSAGGHNGLKSLIESVGGTFTRLRFGVGPLPEGESVIDFVLGKFSSDELPVYEEMVIRAVESAPFYVENGLAKTMNQYNS